MSDALLAELANAAGIGIDWVDANGHAQRVSPEAQRRLLESLGHSAQSEQQIRDSLEELQQRELAALVPPLLTLELGDNLRLGGREAHAAYNLTREDGQVFSGRLDEQASLPSPEHPGYYRLEIGASQLTLAVTPAACRSVQELCGKPRAWGLSAQLYGLRRHGDGGLGDTRALEDLARHAANLGADALAISPVHAMFGAAHNHYSPYSPSSRLFFNVLHAAPGQLLGSEAVASAIATCGLQDEMARLERQELIDWPAVSEARQRLLSQLYRDFRLLDGALLGDFVAFCDAGGDALLQHCRFEALHGHMLRCGESGDWRQWPQALRDPHGPAVRSFASDYADEVGLHAFGQWLIAHGLESAQTVAGGSGMGIGLIADLAVGADPAGSQAWTRQGELLSDVTVGAPPDILNRSGQNWGVAAFSPEGLRRHGYRAFIEMLQANLAHAGGIRIDHVMGLQRLWVIPRGGDAQDGAYLRYPLQDLLRLLALESHRHRALVIGEDLGTVPTGLREELARRNILGMRVLLFEQQDGRFIAPQHWPRDALATSTTHDLPSLGGWFAGRDIDWRLRAGHSQAEREQDDRAERQRETAALRQALAEHGRQNSAGSPDEQLTACIDYLGSTPAPLVLLPLEDATGQVEQPNLPGPGAIHPNWRRRYALPARELLEQPDTRQRLERLDAARREAGNG
ncbi:4-alpha-glucanotransferase [Pseudomonas sp. Gutcm_11s]|uniref:4-alpha-glucanotransferase n=1 Tax=Pseudomonas sp. Gutcm_11s TaxID=3026088 RepID=UPI002361AADF|nr:4-alpha-glucanotransferase [Pseudomonas sp. Gutcm_11s]MDD0843560.1 4-alpha-glucanotransferase [Pseudomonas sp. Gutcm_11s]